MIRNGRRNKKKNIDTTGLASAAWQNKKFWLPHLQKTLNLPPRPMLQNAPLHFTTLPRPSPYSDSYSYSYSYSYFTYSSS